MELVGQSIFQIVHVDDLTGSCGHSRNRLLRPRRGASRPCPSRTWTSTAVPAVAAANGSSPTFAFALRPIEQSEGLPESEVDAPSGETRGSMSLAPRATSLASAKHRSLESLNCRRANSTCLRGCLPGTECRPSQRCSSSLRAPFATISPRSSGS